MASKFNSAVLVIALAAAGCSDRTAQNGMENGSQNGAPAANEDGVDVQTTNSTPGATQLSAPNARRGDHPNASAPVSQSSALRAEHEELEGVFVEIRGLRRTSSGTVTLDYILVNEMVDTLWLDWHNFHWTGPADAALIDLVTGKRYAVMRDNAGNRMATSHEVTRWVAPGEHRELWVRYRLDLDVVQVSVSVPGFPLIDDLPVPH